jgi:hypothetical protein
VRYPKHAQRHPNAMSIVPTDRYLYTTFLHLPSHSAPELIIASKSPQDRAERNGQPRHAQQAKPARAGMLSHVPKGDGWLAIRRRVALVRRARRDGVDVCEAELIAVEAVGLVNLPQSWIVGLDECDVDTLHSVLSAGVPGLDDQQCSRKEELTEYSAAPCRAISTTWMVALSPGLTVALAGSGT